MARITRTSTEPSPTPASNTRTAGGRGWICASSSETRCATSHFSLQVLTNSRYFCRLSKKRKLRCGSPALRRRQAGAGGGSGRGIARALDDGGALALRGMRRHEAVDAVERVGGDAAAIAQPRGELAVVDGAAAEGRFGKPGLAAIVGDFVKQLLRVHGKRGGHAAPCCFLARALGTFDAL